MAAENRVAILMTGRPYHNDPGMNHGVLEEYQAMGYPILSTRSIPKDKDWLEPYFREDLRKGHVDSPLEIQDIWPENYSVNSVQKVWATKFAARHPNVAVLDLSSFRCGMDAPTYGLVDRMVAASRTPYSSLHDIDANKPSGSIKIRVKTYAYTLGLAQEALKDEADKRLEFERSLAQKRLDLLLAAPPAVLADQAIVNEIEQLKTRLAHHAAPDMQAEPASLGFELSRTPDRQSLDQIIEHAERIPLAQID